MTNPEIAIVGAGYVGLPLGRVFAEAGARVLLLDVSADRVKAINRGESYVEDVPDEVLGELVQAGRLSATTDYDVVRETDAIIIALPTPLSPNREPDLSMLEVGIAALTAVLVADGVIASEQAEPAVLEPNRTAEPTVA
jgi:UDP-N-acetyl-D-glucosamine dehydrogenase